MAFAESAPRLDRPWWIGALHLFGLSGFAIAQPLFDLLARNPTFFVAHGMTGVSVVLFAVGVLLIPPVLVVSVGQLIRLISGRAGQVTQPFFVGSLTSLTLVPPLTKSLALPIALIALLYFVIALGVGVAYSRVPFVSRYATLLAAAPVLFLVLFLGFSQTKTLLTIPETVAAGGSHVSKTSVVMLVLDEFSQGTILEPNGSIDPKRFPNFARLAKRSTFYPNVTTNSNLTESALPTMLTGRYPTPGRTSSPTLSVYPNNLFTLLSSTHRLDVNEWVTALCPVSSCPRSPTAATKPRDVLADAAVIYAHAVIPDRLKMLLPDLGFRWGGFLADPNDVEERASKFPGPLRPVARAALGYFADPQFDTLETRRFAAFEQSIRRDEKPTVWFLHVALPHQPWYLMPNGKQFDHETPAGLRPGHEAWVNQDLANQGLQRYVMQARATDRIVGRLIDRLQEQDIWDNTLLVVLADHGLVFEAKRHLRNVTGTEDDIMPIPLFVKFPDQRNGAVDTRNVETIDVTPTIADVLGVQIPWRVDGSSLARSDPNRKTKRIWQWGFEVGPYGTDVNHNKTDISEQIRALFGKWNGLNDLFAFGPYRQLVGKRVHGITAAPATRDAVVSLDHPEWYQDVNLDGTPFVPAKPTGSVQAADMPEWIAVAVNGTIAGLGKPWRQGADWRYSIVVSDRYFVRGRNSLAFFGVDPRGGLTRITARAD